MRLLVNGEAVDAPEAQTITGLLAGLAIRGRIAVEVNGELVPRSTHATHTLVDGDRIEIVQAIGGGQATSFSAGAS